MRNYSRSLFRSQRKKSNSLPITKTEGSRFTTFKMNLGLSLSITRTEDSKQRFARENTMYRSSDSHQLLCKSFGRDLANIGRFNLRSQDGLQDSQDMNVLSHKKLLVATNQSCTCTNVCSFPRAAQLETTCKFEELLCPNLYHSASISTLPRHNTYKEICALEVSAPCLSCSPQETVVFAPPTPFGNAPHSLPAKYEPASLAACSTGHWLHPEARAPAETYASRLSAGLRRADAADAAAPPGPVPTARRAPVARVRTKSGSAVPSHGRRCGPAPSSSISHRRCSPDPARTADSPNICGAGPTGRSRAGPT